MFNREELAWAAGFYDGEGCTYFGTRTNGKSKKRYPIVRMQVGQSEPSTLKRFHAAVGGLGRLDGPHIYHSRKRNKPTWSWRVDGLDAVQAVALLIGPYLSQPKQEQMEDRFAQYRRWVSSS